MILVSTHFFHFTIFVCVTNKYFITFLLKIGASVARKLETVGENECEIENQRP